MREMQVKNRRVKTAKFEESFPAKELHELLVYAVKHVPFYRERLNSSRIQPKSFNSYCDYTSIPILEKSELRNIYFERDRFISDHYEPEDLFCEMTNGSTGTPLFCYKSKSDRVRAGLSAWKVRTWFGEDIVGQPAAAICYVTMGQSLDKGRALKIILDDLSDEKICHAWSEITKFSPTWLYGNASAIYRFAIFLSQNKELLHSRHFSLIELQGDYIIPEYKKLIEDVFEAKVSDQYGCIELWVIAYTCPLGRHHVLEDDIFLEIVDERGATVPDGNVGTVVVTGLNVRAMPFIRYNLGDKARIEKEKCPCGRKWKVIRLEGCRSTQNLIVPDGRRFSASVFHQILTDIFTGPLCAYINSFKITQECPCQIHVAFARGRLFNQYEKAIKDAFTKQVHRRISEHMQVNFSIDDSLIQRGGKTSYFQSRI